MSFSVVEIQIPLPLFPIAELIMCLRMTALAKGHQVRELVRSATRKRCDVMNLFNRCDSSFFQTTLTQWMLLNIKCTDPSPIVPILLIVIRSSAEFVVLLMPQCLMLLTIGIMRKIRTTWIGTWFLWFIWHNHYLLLPMKKAHGYYSMSSNSLCF